MTGANFFYALDQACVEGFEYGVICASRQLKRVSKIEPAAMLIDGKRSKSGTFGRYRRQAKTLENAARAT